MNPQIYSWAGCALRLIGRKDNGRAVWAVRLDDGAVRSYFNNELKCEGGWLAIRDVIAVLPSIRTRKQAEAKAAQEVTP